MSQGTLFSYFSKAKPATKPPPDSRSGPSGRACKSNGSRGPSSASGGACKSNGAQDSGDSDGDIGVSRMVSGRRKRRAVASERGKGSAKRRKRMAIESDSNEDSDEYVPGAEEDNEVDSDSEEGVVECTPVKKKSIAQFSRTNKTNGTSSPCPSTPCTPHTSTPHTAHPPTPYTPHTSTAMASGKGSTTFTHETLSWLSERNRRDREGRRMNDPDYDKRTILVPRDYLRSLTPGLRQWWEIKTNNFDTVIMFKVGKFYELYHMDAVVGVRELGLCFMKGEFAHSGFPEVAFGRYAQTLVQKGYKVARVEQTETPQMMEQRVRQLSQPTKFDRVVRRELCSVVTKGTRTLSFLDYEGHSPSEAAYLLALKEEPSSTGSNCSVYGVCFIDTSIGVFHVGQFEDDRQCSRLRTLLAHHPVAQLLHERANLTQRTLTVVNQLLATSIRDCLASGSEFWSSSKTMKTLSGKSYFKATEEEDLLEWPPVFKTLLDEGDLLGQSASKDYDLAVSSLGACVWYLTKCCIEDQLLSLRNFQLYEPLDTAPADGGGGGESFAGQRMVLDDITLTNLDVLDHHGNTAGTLLERIDHTVTAFGGRLLKQWLCAPLCVPEAIESRLDAVSELMAHSGLVGVAKEGLRRLPDLERLLRKIHSLGLPTQHPDSRAIFYEEGTYSKRKISDFLSVLEGFATCKDVIQGFSPIAPSLKSRLLSRLVTVGGGGGMFPELGEVLSFFQGSFDPAQARKEGVIKPSPGVNPAYDRAVKDVRSTKAQLEDYLHRQKKRLGCKSIVYWGSGRSRYQLEIPEAALRSHTPDDYELKSQKKGFRRYWTAEIKGLLEQLVDGEERERAALKDSMRALFSAFDKHFNLWESATKCVAQLDVLMALATYSGCSDGEMCRPEVCVSEVPFLDIQSGRHPCVVQTFSGDEFIPNDVLISRESGRRCVVVTGPNMGGKSTLMRQTGLIVILAQLGCYVPASSCCLSPVDRLFTRLGASDRIMCGESTFFVELTQTSVILQHSTRHSLVLLDELGRGTATYDGTAIACAVVQELAERVCCRTLFSTHYHSLVEEFASNTHIQLGHMGCVVESGEGEGEETITFLYKFVGGACPKSYGFNAARLAGLPPPVISVARRKAHHLEETSERSRLFKKLCNGGCVGDPSQLAASLSNLL